MKILTMRAAMLAVFAAALFGCGGPRYRHDLEATAACDAIASPRVQRELADAAREAVRALALDALTGESVRVRVAAAAGEEAADVVRLMLEGELRVRGATVVNGDAAGGDAEGIGPEPVSLEVVVDEWGADIVRAGWLRPRSRLLVRVVLDAAIRVEHGQALTDRTVATRALDHAAGWFGCECLTLPAETDRP